MGDLAGATLFALALLAAALFALGMALLTIAAKRAKRARAFPTQLLYGVRCNEGPFTTGEINQQLMALTSYWPRPLPISLDGLNIRFTNDDAATTEPFYLIQETTAVVHAGGTRRVWQTGLAHESAHHALGEAIGHPTATDPDGFFRADVFGPNGAVRLAREATGMPPLPRFTD